MSGDVFSVWQFFADGTQEHVLERVEAERAVPCAHRLTQSIGAQIGTTVRVIITDPGDDTVFEWQREAGVVFPTREQCAEARHA